MTDPASTLILNVDDNAAGRYAVSRVLRGAGFQVLEAATGAEALQALAQRPALVLLDVHLPDASGLAICQQIKTDPATAGTLVIQVSATAVALQDRVAGLAGGADAYLVHPIEPVELVAIVTALLRLQRAERQAAAAGAIWQATFAAIGDGVAVLDRAMHVVHANRALAQLLGRPAAEVAACRLPDLLPGLADHLQPKVDHAAFDLPLPGPQGERWLHARVDALLDEAGAWQGVVCTLSDISERKWAELSQTVLAEVGRLLADPLTMEARLAGLTEAVVPRLGDWCAVHLVQGEAITLAAARHSDPERLALGARVQQRNLLRWDSPGAMAQVLRTGEPLLLTEVTPEVLQDNTEDADHDALLRAMGVRSAVVVPLTARGQVLGALTLATAESGRVYGPPALALAQELGRRAALALDNARLFAAEQEARAAAERAAGRLAQLQAITAALAGARTPAQVTELAVHQGASALGAGAGMLELLSADGAALELAAALGYPSSFLAALQHLPLAGQSPGAEVVRSGQPLWIESMAEFAARYPALAEGRRDAGFEALAVLPLTVEARRLGVLAFSFSERRALDGEDRAFLLALAQQCALALERAKLYAAEQQVRAELEDRVQARTAELHSANLTLASDVAEHKQARTRLARSRQQLRQLSARLEAARETEHARLAREVHDELGSTLSALKMELAWLSQAAAAGDRGLPARLDSINAVLDDVIQSVRRIASDLRPAMLDTLGLDAALEWQAQEFQRRTGLPCALKVEPAASQALAPAAATALFRLFQEALAGVAGRSGVTSVAASLRANPASVELVVRVEGQPEAGRTAALRLLSMRERLRQVSGELDVQTGADGGTRLVARVPVAPAEPPAERPASKRPASKRAGRKRKAASSG